MKIYLVPDIHKNDNLLRQYLQEYTEKAYEEVGFNGEYGYYCFAKPDVQGNVKWEQATCTNK